MALTVAPIQGTPTVAVPGTQPTSAAALVLAANTSRRVALLANNGTATVYIGTTNAVTTSTGYPIPAGQSFQDSASTTAWYGIVATGTADVRTIEVAGSIFN